MHSITIDMDGHCNRAMSYFDMASKFNMEYVHEKYNPDLLIKKVKLFPTHIYLYSFYLVCCNQNSLKRLQGKDLHMRILPKTVKGVW